MASRPKPKAADRGRFRLAVYFVNHQSGSGRAYYFHSNRSQDAMGVSANRLKRLVTQKWDGKVNWAGLYENNHLIAEYKLENNEWQKR